MSIQLEHANVKVPSIKKTEEFLMAAFEDFRIRGGGYNSTFGYWSHIGNDHTYIALLQSAEPGTEIEETIAPYRYDDKYRLMHLGIVVDDLDQLISRLQRKGFVPSITDGLNSHPHRRNVYYLDGNKLEWEFVQYLTEDAALMNGYSD